MLTLGPQADSAERTTSRYILPAYRYVPVSCESFPVLKRLLIVGFC